MMFKKLLIIDGYIDEPTALGVPPYVSPYIRYVAGAGILGGLTTDDVNLITIDDLRKSNFVIPGELKKEALTIFIGGNPVPGKYLGGTPAKPGEIIKISQKNPDIQLIAGGPLQFSFPDILESSGVPVVPGDIEMFVYMVLKGKLDYIPSKPLKRSVEFLNRFAVMGSFIVERYPDHPWIIAEIETGRGCPRKVHCSFCIEGRFPVEFRDEEDIVLEMVELRKYGIKAFRLGKQADIISYKANLTDIKNGFSKPNPKALKTLYSLIRKSIPDLEVLHLDNANPGTIATFPEESREILETIVENNTEGDVAAMGMETADMNVIRKNRLKATPSQVFKAIRIVNETGGVRVNGIPKLLPGLNFIHGLPGETADTFKKNYNFLLKVLESGLLIRRINIRQLVISKGTPLSNVKIRRNPKLDASFKKWRAKIRKEIDTKMIEKVFPIGTKIRKIRVEAHRFEWSIARPLGTYPITMEIPLKLETGTILDAFVINHRERSLIGLPLKSEIKKLPPSALKTIKNIKKSKIGEFITQKMKLSREEVIRMLAIPREIEEKLVF